MEHAPAPDKLEELDRDACLALLDTAKVGRVAYVSGDAPTIVPVNFTRDGEEIVIRVGAGSGLLPHRGSVVAFEVDDVSTWLQAGRSVLVVGRAAGIDDAERTSRLRRKFQPWAGGGREEFVGIGMERVTGRRIAAEPDEVSGQPV